MRKSKTKISNDMKTAFSFDLKLPRSQINISKSMVSKEGVILKP